MLYKQKGSEKPFTTYNRNFFLIIQFPRAVLRSDTQGCHLFSPFFLQGKVIASIFVPDNGVTAAHGGLLVKGNPVKIGSYTRSCESVNSSVIFCHCPCGWEGAARKTSQKTCLIVFVLYNASGKGFINNGICDYFIFVRWRAPFWRGFLAALRVLRIGPTLYTCPAVFPRSK